LHLQNEKKTHYAHFVSKGFVYFHKLYLFGRHLTVCFVTIKLP